MAYPSPELFAAPGPYQSTINYRYLKQHGFLPDTELALELLQDYLLDDIPGGGISSDLPAGRDIQDRLNKDQHSQNQIINHNQSCGVNARDGAVEFRQGASLALVPFLGPSPAEIYGGPFGESAPTPLPPVPEHSPHPQQVDQKTAGIATSHPPMIAPRIKDSAAPSLTPSTSVAKPVKSCSGKDQWLPGELEQVAYLREVKHLNWTQIRESIGRHTQLSITDKYYAEKRKAKSRKRMESGA